MTIQGPLTVNLGVSAIYTCILISIQMIECQPLVESPGFIALLGEVKSVFALHRFDLKPFHNRSIFLEFVRQILI